MSRILLVVASPPAAGTLQPAIDLLRARGHVVEVAVEGEGACPRRRGDDWREPIVALRGYRDYVRHLGAPPGAGAVARQQALHTTVAPSGEGQVSAPCPACRASLRDDDLGRLLLGLGADGVDAVASLFTLAEDEVPSDPGYDAFLRDVRPAVVVVTPLVAFGSGQPDVIKSCRALGIPAVAVATAGDVASGGAVHVSPDRFLVLGDDLAQEARDDRGTPPGFTRVASDPVLMADAIESVAASGR